MDGQWTCGKGLAENASLPAKLSELLDAVADNLEAHMPAIQRSNENGQMEFDAYALLVAEHRRIATSLLATAELMGSYRDLPMADHDERKMASPQVIEAFERLMGLEAELSTLLIRRMEQHREIRASMYAG